MNLQPKHQVVIEHNENNMKKLTQCLTEEWGCVITLAAHFHSELVRWKALWMRQQKDSLSITIYFISNLFIVDNFR